ncbi:hypothetical protein OTB20_01635 [Streptomyces sp. H27-H1]|uniref:hypothetical protein n=1 Tax=Streptomyces sp. H27-H1 TaxID=2996461 RepID=UPI00226FC1CB|nr:hypothetical protein [Streptomyces sp. H27-H1]MCY0924932.1 hypothetical protein [Streptomyces sp. H27-H1]
MPRPRRRYVLAVLLGWALLVAAFAPGAAVALPAPTAAVADLPGAYAAPLPGASGSDSVRPAEPGSAFGAGRAYTDRPGPACAPRDPGQGGAPALPARAGADQAQPSAAAEAPAGVPGRSHAIPVRVLVRGPARSAPSPLELSVMRV